MTQPPRLPLQPLQPMAPLEPMRPLVPMQPLQPGQRRGDQPPPPYQQPYRQAYVPALEPVYQPPPAYEPVPQMASPSVQQQVVNLGLSQSPAGGVTWGGLPRPKVPTRVRSGGGSNKAGAVIGVVVAAIVGLAAVGSHSSSGGSPDVTVPTFSLSIPPLSTGTHHEPSQGTQGSSSGTHAAPSKPTHQSSRALEINGSTDGQRIRVAFLHLVNNATPKDTFMDSPDNGNRLVAAQFRVTNIGEFIYVASATNVAHLVDTKGHTYDAQFLFDNIKEGKVFNGVVNVDTGHTVVGYIGFEVPKKAKIKKVEFSASPSGGQTATWTFV